MGPGDGHYRAFQPGAGIAMGYGDLKVIEARGFLRSVAEGRSYGADLGDAVQAALTLDALSSSVGSASWVALDGRPAVAGVHEGSRSP